MINSRDIADLDPRVQPICRKHVELCDAAGIELLVTSTYRDAESQDDLYAIGRTKDMGRKPVTKAKGGQSYHNFRVAWDVVPLVGGKAQWNSPLWKEIIALGKQAGAESGAEWKTFPDRPHFQMRKRGDGSLITLIEAKGLFDQRGSIFA